MAHPHISSHFGASGRIALAAKLQDVYHYFGSVLNFYNGYRYDSTFPADTLLKRLELMESGGKYLQEAVYQILGNRSWDDLTQEEQRWCDGIDLTYARDIRDEAEMQEYAEFGIAFCKEIAAYHRINARLGECKEDLNV